MASISQVERTVVDLIGRLDDLDASSRLRLPSRRLIQTDCPDLDLQWHALWQDRVLGELNRGPAPGRPDIRIRVNSDDLLALAQQQLEFRAAWQEGRIRIDASVTDLLRLRTAL